MTGTNERRRRLLALGGQAIGWWALGALAGCGGGEGADGGEGDGGTAPPPPAASDLQGAGVAAAGTPGAPVSAAQRLATLQAAQARTAQLAAGGVRFDAVALAQALLAEPTLQRVGLSSRMDNLWARFTDGSLLVVPHNLAPAAPATAQAAPAARRRAAAAGSDLPAVLTAPQYRQLDMFGELPFASTPDTVHLSSDDIGPDTLPALRRMALGRGFVLPALQQQPAPDSGVDNGIAGLAAVADDGVFFITACGAQAGPDDTPRSVICTATAADEASLALYAADIAAGRVVPCVTWRAVGGAWQPFAALAITVDFVRQAGWSFPVNSLGILNVTGGGALADWHGALGAAGLDNLVAWEQAVPWQRMVAFADDLIQLSLATNRFDSRLLRQDDTPRLRAYGVGPTLEHLQALGVTAGGIWYAPSHAPERFVGTLLPTIDYALIDEERERIELVGQFGARADTANGRPAIRTARTPGPAFTLPELAHAADGPLGDGDPLPGPNWAGNLLSTDLRPGQLAEGGYLQVFNGGRTSNVVPVTHWTIVVRAATTVDALTLDIDLTLHLRADVHGWRLGPTAEPRNGIPQTSLSTMTESFAAYRAAGTISRRDDSRRTVTTVDWSGSGRIDNVRLAPRQVTMVGLMDWASRRLTMPQVVVNGTAVIRQHKVVEQFDVNGELLSRTETTDEVPVQLQAYGTGDGSLELQFDDGWKLQAGAFDLPPEPSDVLPAPPQLLRRTRLTWAAVEAACPPADTYGGT